MPSEWGSQIARARSWAVGQPRLAKRAFIASSDFVLLSFAIWLAFSIRWGRFYVPENGNLLLVLLSAPIIGVAVFHTFGLYRLVTRFLGHRGALRIVGGVGLSVLLWSVAILMAAGTGNPNFVVPRLVIVIYGVLAALLVWSSRELAGKLLGGAGLSTPADADRRRVVIFGAGTAGVALLDALRRAPGYEPVGFIEDEPSLIGQHVRGLKVYRIEKLARLVERDHVQEVLLALPETQRRQRREIIQRLAAHPVRVKVMPAMEDIASGRIAVTDLRPIEVDDLLGRDPVPPVADLMERTILGKSVMVTGAGGSIGSELVRQALRQGPRCLVLLDVSESALYTIGTEVRDTLDRLATLSALAPSPPHIVSVLGSVLDANLLRATIKTNGVETIYHAAAYKHVPLVEANPAAGLRNNTFGSATLVDVARQSGVARVALISTDKAVRPTNVMGASKRLAELVFQAAAAAASGPDATVFTIVRFGNVLDSSGSVVRRFKQQIEDGGPVTVTHPEIIRYFMSIPEAASLVIQAGAMARGGEVFVLDMGEPVKIAELARTMIRLMGRDVRDEANPDGDIAIQFIGLRPGEKLYEELLIDERAARTEHPRIRQNAEPFRPEAQLREELATLEAALNLDHIENIQALLSRTVEGYSPDPMTAMRRLDVWVPVSRTLH